MAVWGYLIPTVQFSEMVRSAKSYWQVCFNKIHLKTTASQPLAADQVPLIVPLKMWSKDTKDIVTKTGSWPVWVYLAPQIRILIN